MPTHADTFPISHTQLPTALSIVSLPLITICSRRLLLTFPDRPLGHGGVVQHRVAGNNRKKGGDGPLIVV